MGAHGCTKCLRICVKFGVMNEIQKRTGTNVTFCHMRKFKLYYYINFKVFFITKLILKIK